MAQLMKNIYGTNNAYEYSETVSVTTTDAMAGENIFIPSNVATVVLGLSRTSGTGRYKIQITMSTTAEVTNGDYPSVSDGAHWLDWEIDSDLLDDDGYTDEDLIQYWIPVPGHLRLVVQDDSSATSVYMGIRAN